MYDRDPADMTGMKCLPAILFCAGIAAAQSAGPTASPGSLTFNYQVNSTIFPAPAKLTATLPAATSTLSLSVVSSSSPQGWLTVTPDSGHSPLAMTVTVNPTSLTPGSYSGTITINSVPAGSNPAVVSVTLSISNPPSTLLVSSTSPNYAGAASGAAPPTLTLTYTTGAVVTSPPSSQIDVASNGDIIPFNVTASASGGAKASAVWLRVNGAGQLPNLTTSGVALSGSYVPITVTLDMANVSGLNPGSYTGLITVAASSSVNGSATVAVNLIVSAGAPQLDSIFPSGVIAGPVVDPVVTVYGDNFFATSVVTIQQGANPPITLTSTLLSRKVLQATIKAAYLTTAGTWTLAVTNPAPPNIPAQSAPTTSFTVTSPTMPAITSVVNSASFLATAVHTGTGANPVAPGAVSVSPREIISIFGKNLGPAGVMTNTSSGTPPAYGTTAGPVQVWFDYTGNTNGLIAAPIIMTSSNQVNCLVPIELAAVIGTAGPNARVIVQNGVNSTPVYTLTVVAADPGVFTFGGLGARARRGLELRQRLQFVR